MTEHNYNVVIDEIYFEWNSKKNSVNIKKHHISFKEAATVFFDSNYIEIDDPDHSENESRLLALGFSSKNRLLIVCHCEIVNDRIRIISARKATKNEATQYGGKTNAKRI
jgi:uncharacterized DUF497 family protein